MASFGRPRPFCVSGSAFRGFIGGGTDSGTSESDMGDEMHGDSDMHGIPSSGMDPTFGKPFFNVNVLEAIGNHPLLLVVVLLQLHRGGPHHVIRLLS